jgi:hypothetical protein
MTRHHFNSRQTSFDFKVSCPPLHLPRMVKKLIFASKEWEFTRVIHQNIAHP